MPVHCVCSIGRCVVLGPIHANRQVPVRLFVVFFQSFDGFFRSLAELILKCELFIGLSDFLGYLLVISLLLALDKVAEAAIFLLFLQFFPSVRTECIVHLHTFLLELDERAAALGHQGVFILLRAIVKWLLIEWLHRWRVRTFNSFPLGDFTDLDQPLLRFSFRLEWQTSWYLLDLSFLNRCLKHSTCLDLWPIIEAKQHVLFEFRFVLLLLRRKFPAF